jgi:hypothetical protein
MSVGASSNALSYLQQLLQQGTAGASNAAGAPDPLSELLQTLSGSSTSTDPLTAPSASTSTAAGSSCSSCAAFGSGMMATLISMQGQPPGGATPSQMFATFDTNGDGQISKAEFNSAFSQAGVDSATTDAAFAKLDANGDGSISPSELAKARHGHGHHHHHAEGSGDAQGGSQTGQNPLDALLSGANAAGATSKTANNQDGSSTTTITYADGTTIDMTTPASSTNGANASNGNSSGAGNQSAANLLEQLIKLQAQMLTTTSSTLSAIA